MKTIVYQISRISIIFLGSNQRVILNTGVRSNVIFVYLKGQGIRRKIEYMCQRRGVNPKFEFLGGKNRGDIVYDGKS